jgi:hypothetical protein
MIITTYAEGINSFVSLFDADGYAIESPVIAEQHQLPSVVRKLLNKNAIIHTTVIKST